MIVYNVTLSIDPAREQEVMHWLQTEHVPEVLDTGLFLQVECFKVFERPGMPHNSYALQYRLSDWSDYSKYLDTFAAALQAKTRDRFGEHVLAFRTFLQKEWELGQPTGGQAEER